MDILAGFICALGWQQADPDRTFIWPADNPKGLSILGIVSCDAKFSCGISSFNNYSITIYSATVPVNIVLEFWLDIAYIGQSHLVWFGRYVVAREFRPCFWFHPIEIMQFDEAIIIQQLKWRKNLLEPINIYYALPSCDSAIIVEIVINVLRVVSSKNIQCPVGLIFSCYL